MQITFLNFGIFNLCLRSQLLGVAKFSVGQQHLADLQFLGQLLYLSLAVFLKRDYLGLEVVEVFESQQHCALLIRLWHLLESAEVQERLTLLVVEPHAHPVLLQRLDLDVVYLPFDDEETLVLTVLFFFRPVLTAVVVLHETGVDLILGLRWENAEDTLDINRLQVASEIRLVKVVAVYDCFSVRAQHYHHFFFQFQLSDLASFAQKVFLQTLFQFFLLFLDRDLEHHEQYDESSRHKVKRVFEYGLDCLSGSIFGLVYVLELHLREVVLGLLVIDQDLKKVHLALNASGYLAFERSQVLLEFDEQYVSLVFLFLVQWSDDVPVERLELDFLNGLDLFGVLLDVPVIASKYLYHTICTCSRWPKPFRRTFLWHRLLSWPETIEKGRSGFSWELQGWAGRREHA